MKYKNAPNPSKIQGVFFRGARQSKSDHSCRKASIGSIFAARIAGYTPKTTPMKIEIRNAKGTDQKTMIGLSS